MLSLYGLPMVVQGFLGHDMAMECDFPSPNLRVSIY